MTKHSPGRPKKPPGQARNTPVTFNTTSVLYSILTDEAEEKGVPLSEFVHDKLARIYTRKDNQNPEDGATK